jgi:hypothetical protein
MTAAAWTAIIIAEARMVADGWPPFFARIMAMIALRNELVRRMQEASHD